jgi:hypothetical protein
MAIYVPQIIDNLNSTSTVDGLSANQGRVLNNQQGELTNLSTSDKNSLVNAINELDVNYENFLTLIDNINGEVI